MVDKAEQKRRDEENQHKEWQWARHMQKKNMRVHDGHTYNLYRQWYYFPEHEKHQDPRWWLLKSGMPYPSYHTNPTRNFPPRTVWIEGAQDPCEELRAPRIRLAPDELLERKYFLSAVQQKAEEQPVPVKIRTLNLSYQNLGEEYQYEQMLSFLKINAGVACLALTDNFLTDLHGFHMPFLQVVLYNVLHTVLCIPWRIA